MKFDYFYGGHVEMVDLGFDGLSVDQRIESNEHLSTVFQEARAMALLMDGLTYDTLWFAEHHFQREGFGGIPNIPMLAVYLAQHTRDLHFGSMFNTVPAWHPLRLAEDFAVADLLSEGRFRFGIGRGYIPRELATLGSPLEDDPNNRTLFEEQVEIIFKAWNKTSFSHSGAHYEIPPGVSHRGQQLEEITLVPRPNKLPVECWQPIFSANPRGLAFMVRHGIKGVVPAGNQAAAIAAKWQDSLAQVGRKSELGEGLALVLQVHLADTKEKAVREATPWFEEQLKVLAPLGRMPTLAPAQIQATVQGGATNEVSLPTVADLVRDGAWICGPPEHVVESIAEILEHFPGLERIAIGAGGLGMPPSVILQDLEWFGREVLPTFREEN